IYEAQRDRAMAALETAQVNLDAVYAARATTAANLQSASAQFDLVLSAARFEELPERLATWTQESLEEVDLPTWYFDKTEEIAAAQVEVEAATKELETEQSNYDQLILGITSADFEETEVRLADAKAAFIVAKQVLDRAMEQDNSDIEAYAQNNYDAARAELESAQSEYDQTLTDQSAQDVIDARARISVAGERYEMALDRLNSLLTGEESLAVQAAMAAVEQAEAALAQADVSITQAEKVIAQAQAEIALIDTQIKKLTLCAPLNGVVLTRNIEPGEMVSPGGGVMTIGNLGELTITVFIPEDRYGEVTLGQEVEVTVDSFPDVIFSAGVVSIADRAEYTPRNVQTEEGRRTTVFSIKLLVEDPNARLKPGMPADVLFK
ncbi:MAG: efflux RND transporter periplasmic adaptor subunit, partial [Anaerolineaceae bacterium]|nr:efflux RND transporter periplasmic adaptor subunit [Anaerolineaceae bacterium]